MNHRNIEIKARTTDPDRAMAILRDAGARYVGEDHQVDTYFRVPQGRLKLRQGNIENSLIYYERPDQDQPKTSNFTLSKVTHTDTLRDTLSDALGILTIVDKRRHIFFIDHVKFHVDNVDGLGSFVEIEVTDMKKVQTLEAAEALCARYMTILGIGQQDLVHHSYSDMILALRT